MADTSRVAVYIDFDNMVISRYDDVHGDGSWRRDDARRHGLDTDSHDEVDARLAEAEVDLGAIIDYASSFGTVALTRAYADWSAPANASYKHQLIDRAVDLVQLFTTSGTKNGADIRLSVDAVDDLFQHADITHVVIVGGDSDYIALAQRCKRMGRYVVGIGVTGSISRALVAACDEYSAYSDLPSVAAPHPRRTTAEAKARLARGASDASAGVDADADADTDADADADTDADEERGEQAEPDEGDGTASATGRGRRRSRRASSAPTPEQLARTLLQRAIRVGMEKSDDGWLHSSSVKSQMQRMDSTFKEKSLGFATFRAFVEAQDDLVEAKVLENGQLAVRLT